MAFFSETTQAVSAVYLEDLKKQILACKYLATNNLTADFVGSRGFSVVFTRAGMGRVIEQFPFFETYVATLLDADCNAFYLNPLVLASASRVNPHIDRSLRAYCPTVETPLLVSVLYVTLPEDMSGGELVLTHRKRQVGRIVPAVNKVVRFQGDLTHQVSPVVTQGKGLRISLVCEQYRLEAGPLAQIPEMGIESQNRRY
ncbi:MAG: 2OG-Fe(II) oxygenase [Candidatus Sericytochromatia bacterium]|nr:2OG-Fe(II) oxygenase [Candidatus Sericytochromatia bacterium]